MMGQQEILDVLRAHRGTKFTSSEILDKVSKVCGVASVSACLRKLRKSKFIKYEQVRVKTHNNMRVLYLYWV